MTDLITRLRTWSHARHAAPASDLMDEAADAIKRLRSQPCPYVTGSVTRYCTLNTSENPNGSMLTDAEREAVEWAIFEYGATHPDHGMAAQRAATLRGLLERLG